MTHTIVRTSGEVPTGAVDTAGAVRHRHRLDLGRKWLIVVLLGGLLVLASGLRLYQLGDRGMGHVESYTPGLHFPPDISDPAPRLTLGRAITGPMFEEPHPPAWYALMWPWTKVFGTDLVTIRLPSVVLGVVSIGLIFWLGLLAHTWQTGLVAAAFLTLNGHHLLFSQVARPTSLAVALSILSTALLVLIARGSGPRRVALGAYLLVTLVGMATLYYFWPIVAAQMVWVGLRGAGQSPSLMRMLRWQWLLVILGSPLVTLAIFQQFNSFLDADGLAIMLQFLEFGFLFEPDNFNVLSTQAYIPDVVRLALPIVCLALIGLGVLRTRWQSESDLRLSLAALPSRALVAAAALAVVTIVAETLFFQHHRPGRLIALLASTTAPIAVLVGICLATRWPGLERRILRLRPIKAFPSNDVALMYVMTFVPVALITGVSLFIPFFASRHMLLYTPYLLIITGVGTVELFKLCRTRVLRLGFAALVVGLIAVHLSSIAYSRDRLVTLVDYKGLANRWLPELQAGDLILVQPHWATTPIFYYLDCAQYTCIGTDYEATLDASRPRRVWALSVGDTKALGPALRQALTDFVHVRDVEAHSITAELYTSE
jgi:hypothetical protein